MTRCVDMPLSISGAFYVLILLAHCPLLGCESPSDPQAELDQGVKEEKYFMSDPALNEVSGMVQSRRHPRVIWVHNDSLNTPRLLAINPQGELVGAHETPRAFNVDWEDLTLGPMTDHHRGELIFVGDTGNNFHWRRDLKVYVFAEPDQPSTPNPRGLKTLGILRYRFPQRGQIPPLDSRSRCRDVEAIFWMEDGLYMVAKCFWGGRAPLYRLPLSTKLLNALQSRALEPDPDPHPLTPPVVTLEHMTDLWTGGRAPPFAYRVTGADYQASTQRLAILTYWRVLLFKMWVNPNGSPTSLSVERLGTKELNPRRSRQVEAISWVDHERIYIANEQRDLFILPVSDFRTNLSKRMP